MTDPYIAFLTQPVVLVAIALILLAVRIVFHAKQLKSAAKEPALLKLMGAEQPKVDLDVHRESQTAAKQAPAENLKSARRIVKNYAAVFKRSRHRKGVN